MAVRKDYTARGEDLKKEVLRFYIENGFTKTRNKYKDKIPRGTLSCWITMLKILKSIPILKNTIPQPQKVLKQKR